MAKGKLSTSHHTAPQQKQGNPKSLGRRCTMEGSLQSQKITKGFEVSAAKSGTQISYIHRQLISLINLVLVKWNTVLASLARNCEVNLDSCISRQLTSDCQLCSPDKDHPFELMCCPNRCSPPSKAKVALWSHSTKPSLWAAT